MAKNIAIVSGIRCSGFIIVSCTDMECLYFISSTFLLTSNDSSFFCPLDMTHNKMVHRDSPAEAAVDRRREQGGGDGHTHQGTRVTPQH